jgi:hypothetical protein
VAALQHTGRTGTELQASSSGLLVLSFAKICYQIPKHGSL